MKKIILFLLIFYFLAISNALSAGLTILTEDLPPMNYKNEDGEKVGPAVDIVEAIKKRVKCNDEIMIYPWKRAVRLAEKEENVVVFSMEWTKDRDKKFQWIGPIAEKRDILVAKKNPGFQIKSWEDIKLRKIGTIYGDVKHNKLERMGCKLLEPVSTEQQNIKKLVKGRIDLWIFKEHRYIEDKPNETKHHDEFKNIGLTNHLICKQGYETLCDKCDINYNTLEILPLPKDKHYDESSFLFIVFSRKTDDKIVKKWNNAFNEMRKDGTLKDILEKKYQMKLPPDFEYFEKHIKNKSK